MCYIINVLENIFATTVKEFVINILLSSLYALNNWALNSLCTRALTLLDRIYSPSLTLYIGRVEGMSGNIPAQEKVWLDKLTALGMILMG